MDDIEYLTFDMVLDVYAIVIGCPPETAKHYLRSRDVLASAVTKPQNWAHYHGADLALQAAVLAHGIAEGQPFIDGNKRTALAALRTFLRFNGYDFFAPPLLRGRWMVNLSQGLSPESLAAYIRRFWQPI